MTSDKFRDAVCDIVRQIPPGKVYTYGRVADLAGYLNCSRQVGYVLKTSSLPDLPWHRVVNSRGRLAPGHPDQRQLLLREGISFRPNGFVDLSRCLWHPEDFIDI